MEKVKDVLWLSAGGSQSASNLLLRASTVNKNKDWNSGAAVSEF
jgi:hypothetical protein